MRTNHRMSAPVVRVSGSRAIVEAPAAIDVRFDLSGVETELVSFTRLLYRAERRDAVWKIQGLTAIYERDTLTPVVPGAALHLDTEELQRYRKSCRFLAYHLSLHGGAIRDDVYGDDRPAEVDALYQREFAWLRAD